MASQLLDSIAIEGPSGQKVRVRFYADGSMRFKVLEAGPMVIAEAFMTGHRHDVIVKLEPRGPSTNGDE
jgi:hypothetical protein